MSLRKQIRVLDDGTQLPFKVLKSAAGYYIGTEINGEPYSRESAHYWNCTADAKEALRTGDWQQRKNEFNKFRREFYKDLFK